MEKSLAGDDIGEKRTEKGWLEVYTIFIQRLTVHGEVYG